MTSVGRPIPEAGSEGGRGTAGSSVPGGPSDRDRPPGEAGARFAGRSDSPTVLRAKYLDVCSARVAEAILSLTPDEAYLLAEEAARTGREPRDAPFSHDDLVRLATAHLSLRLDLPSYEAFVTSYLRDPEPWDREMLGLWHTDVERPG